MHEAERSGGRRAFVFGGGGVLGFAWTIGALTAVQHELGVHPGPSDLVVGTSAGAVTAGLLGCGLNVDSIRRHQLGAPLPEDPPIQWDHSRDTGGSLPPRPGWRPGSPRLVWGAIRNRSDVSTTVALSGLLPAGRGTLEPVRRMVSAVKDATGTSSWPDRRTWIVTTDYRSGHRVVFGQDDAPSADLADAVAASCAIPAWYAPVRIGDRAYVDGGAASNASVDLLKAAGYEEVYVFAPMAALVPDRPRRPFTMLERRVRRGITRGIAADVASLRAAGTRVVVLTPGAEDLALIGANLMNSGRRLAVLRSAMRTTATEIRMRRHQEVPSGKRSSV